MLFLCTEDRDSGDLTTESSSSSSSSNSECSKESSESPSIEPSPRAKGLSRRQRKNRKREESPPEKQKKQAKAKKKPTKPSAEMFRTLELVESHPRKMVYQVNMKESTFAKRLQNYVLTYDEMVALGYPVQIRESPALVEIHKPTHNFRRHHFTKFDVNAREFVPKKRWVSNDSGRGSGNSSDFDSEESSSSSEQECNVGAGGEGISSPNFVCKSEDRFTRTCSRCGHYFFTTMDEYVTTECCLYHWGRLHTVNGLLEYQCCGARSGTRGCSISRRHVWDGVAVGRNGPFDDFIFTKKRRSPHPRGNYGVYALDCEMCYTVRGLELTKVSVVNVEGRLVYDSLVRPQAEIVDYNTRFSGITAKDLNRRGATKSLREVQADLLQFISAETVLVGHSLEGDLRALKIAHQTVVDTALCFPHYKGLPWKCSLKSLAATHLGKEIQCNGANGHDSYEDAATCMELMLWRVRKDYKMYLVYRR